MLDIQGILVEVLPGIQYSVRMRKRKEHYPIIVMLLTLCLTRVIIVGISNIPKTKIRLNSASAKLILDSALLGKALSLKNHKNLL